MKISVHTGKLVNLFGFEEGCRMICDAGFDGIDWNFNDVWDQKEVRQGRLGYCIFEENTEVVLKAYEERISAIRKSGLRVFQAHAPFPAYVPGFPELSKRVPKIYENCIRLCGAVKIPYLVIHGISRAYNGADMTRREMMEKNIGLYSSMISAIKETGVMVLLENIFWDLDEKFYDATCSDPDEAVELIDTLNDIAGEECFGLCFDVGHCNLLRWEMSSYIRKLGKRIKALHLHDNDGRGDWHGFPGSGTVNWKELCNLLKEIEYDGTLNFETYSYYDLNRVMPEVVPVMLKYLAELGKEFGKAIKNI